MAIALDIGVVANQGPSPKERAHYDQAKTASMQIELGTNSTSRKSTLGAVNNRHTSRRPPAPRDLSVADMSTFTETTSLDSQALTNVPTSERCSYWISTSEAIALLKRDTDRLDPFDSFPDLGSPEAIDKIVKYGRTGLLS